MPLNVCDITYIQQKAAATVKKALRLSTCISKGELPKLSQPHHPTVILGHLIIPPPQSPQLDASPPAQSHYCMQSEPPGLRSAASLHH